MFIKTVCTILCLINGICCSEWNIVTAYTDEEFEGEVAEINATDCVSPLPAGFNDSISSINTHGHCVNLYKDEECEGEYIVIEPGTLAHEHLTEWGDFNDKISSIGPCYEECDIRSLQTWNSSPSPIVTIFDHYNYIGHHEDINVKGCVEVPAKLNTQILSIQLNSTPCVEFHENWNCTGKSVQFSSGMSFLRNLGYYWNWGFTGHAEAISICGFNCNRKDPTVLNVTSPPPNTVTLFDKVDYNGNFINYDLGNGCTNVSEEWKRDSKSIKIYDQCIIVYKRFDCSKHGNNTVLDNSNLNIHRQLKNLRRIRSMQLCSSTVREHNSPESGDSNIQGSGSYQIITFTILGLFILGSGLVALIITRSRRAGKGVLTSKEIDMFFRGSDSLVLDTDSIEYLALRQSYDDNYEVPKDLLYIDMKSILGTGEYAIVYKGIVQIPNSTLDQEVAVKLAKPNSGVEYVRTLLREIKTMIYVGQNHRIVELIGCCTQNLRNADLFVMMELCEHGSLDQFLICNRESFKNIVEKGQINLEMLAKDRGLSSIKKRDSESHDYSNISVPSISTSYFNTMHLLEWSLQIAEGMEFLAQKNVIHGDLSARSILLDSNFNAKISGFGTSRYFFENVQYSKKNQLPLRWRYLAIESLRSVIFSTESNVWSFGITMWEIFTLGKVPYLGLRFDHRLVSSLVNGLRLPQPTFATTDCYDIMLSCWREEPSDRISFPELRLMLKEILDQFLRQKKA